MQAVGIKYVGKKELHQDHLYGTNLTWEPGQVHPVSPAVAEKMAAHDDTYEKAELSVSELKSAVVVEKKDAVKDQTHVEDDRKDAPLLVDLSVLDKKGLQDYALQNFNEKLPATMKEDTMRSRIQAFSNRK